jgi:hypothetical protein
VNVLVSLRLRLKDSNGQADLNKRRETIGPGGVILSDIVSRPLVRHGDKQSGFVNAAAQRTMHGVLQKPALMPGVRFGLAARFFLSVFCDPSWGREDHSPAPNCKRMRCSH